MNERHTVVQCEPLAEAPRNWLAERVRLVTCSQGDPEFADALRDAHGLIVRTTPSVGPELLGRTPRLRVIGRAGVGLDHIDLAACRDKGVKVVYTPEANTQAVTEYVVSILCHAVRPLHPLTEAVDEVTWRSLRTAEVAGRQLDTLTLGILGRGRIGTRITQVARSIGMVVLYHDVRDVPPCGDAISVDPATLFASSDIISVHVDGRASNHHFVGSPLLDRMRPNVIFVNTSRGFVVDGVALARFLAGHPDARAHLDVHEAEPIPPENPLWREPGAMLYPHLASRTAPALEAMSWVVRDVIEVLEGRPPVHPAPPGGD